MAARQLGFRQEQQRSHSILDYEHLQKSQYSDHNLGVLEKTVTLTLTWLGEGVILPPSPHWFSLNNSEMIKAVTLVFCIIQYNFIRDIHAKFGIPTLPQSPNIGQNSDRGISNFWISGQSLIKVNCHISRASDDIDTKLGPVTTLDKRNKIASKKIDNEVMSANVTSLSFFQFMANLEQSRSRIPDAQSAKLTFSLIVTFYSTKSENRTKNL